jgi:glucose-6-phosphate 1-epimerase
VRGGVPICWPWFGALVRNPDPVRAMARSAEPPAHGLVRDRDWTLLTVEEQADCTEVTLGFIADHLLQTQWPHAASLELAVRVGRTLQLRLTTRNLGDHPITVSQALHTYLAVSDIDQVAVTGFEGTRYIDTLDDWRERQQQGAIRFTGETDRIYLGVPPSVQLEDRGWERSIELRAENSASAVVWNPWVEKSARLSQLDKAAWRTMACIETANVMGDVVTLAPGADAALGIEIGVPR